MMRLKSRLFVASVALLVCRLALADEADMAVGVSDAQLTELGQRWAAAINDRDVPSLNGLLDTRALGVRAAATMFTPSETERDDFVQGFARGAARLATTWISQVEAAEGSALFLKVHSFDGMRGPLVRYDLGDQGYNYLLLIAERREAAEPRVVDLFLATTGQRFSDTLGVISQMLVAPNDSLLGRMFGLTGLDEELVKTFSSIGELQRAGRTADAFAKVQALPEPIRNHRVMMNLSVQFASLLSEDLYREELARLARYHRDDPTAAFMLIDYYFYKGDIEAAMGALLGMERAFGTDGAIAILKANLSVEAGDLFDARRFARQSIDLEPGNELGHLTLLTILMLSEEYADGIEVLEGLERDFGYAFDESVFADNEIYVGFVRSPEYATWIKER
jgi:hypothetical protein